ncbi:MAG: tRNA (adenosine(37)-N6)-dimethylallyltransferase MiaA [bacterium]
MNVFILFGQTATGKTTKALELVHQYDGEIINFDSRQIYKKLNIVTGKDKPTDSKCRIWLYDIVDPKNIFSSAEYADLAINVINDVVSRGKTPILVGGTGYYLRHLLFGTPEIHIAEDWPLRKQLETKTIEELQTLLNEKKPSFLEGMNNSDRNNPRRLIRRIEVADKGGYLPLTPQQETLTARLSVLQGCKNDFKISYLSFFHSLPSAAREKITHRVEARMAGGAVEEVKNLLKEGYSKNDPGLNAIGYQQLIGYLRKELTLSEAKKQWITREVQYAKRQKTYFNKYFSY